jgi:hypothetical protein
LLDFQKIRDNVQSNKPMNSPVIGAFFLH